MILLGGGNYLPFLESFDKVCFYSTNDIYSRDIDFRKSEDVVVISAFMTLKARFGKKQEVKTDKPF